MSKATRAFAEQSDVITGPTMNAMRAATEAERVALRSIIARTALVNGEEKMTECPCGWFYKGARCPDKTCVEWKKANGTKRVKLAAHEDDDGQYEIGRKLGLDGDSLGTFSGWGYELVFDADVDMETGEVKLLTINGHNIEY